VDVDETSAMNRFSQTHTHTHKIIQTHLTSDFLKHRLYSIDVNEAYE